MDYTDVLGELERGNRVLLMMRHAERPKLDPEDPTFGEVLPITEAGQADARRLGESLKAWAGDVQFCSSPLRRTVMTARCVAEGMGVGGAEIPVDELLGNSSFYFADARVVWEQFRGGDFYRKVFAYFAAGKGPGFVDLAAATDALEAWAMERFTARLGIFATHDLYNAAFAVARGVVERFTEETWVGFLESAAIIVEPGGRRRYALVRR